MNAEQWAALGTVVNAVVVIVLAVINCFYLRIAARQATASETQAEAAKAQAQLASETLALLKAQIDEQSGLTRRRAIDTFRELQANIEAWIPRVEANWGTLPDECSLLPETWTVACNWAEKSYPDLAPALDTIRRKVAEAMPVIENVISTPVSGRVAKVPSMRAAVANLRQAIDAINAVRLIIG